VISPEECRQYAIECDAMARDEKNEETRERMLALARVWRELAQQMVEVAGDLD
jgi:hypothetical protein